MEEEVGKMTDIGREGEREKGNRKEGREGRIKSLNSRRLGKVNKEQWWCLYCLSVGRS